MKVESTTELTLAQKELLELRKQKQQQQNGLVVSQAKEAITLCVDLSGSMAMGFYNMSRADAAKHAMDAIIRASNSAQSQYGLVSFTHEAYQVLPMASPFGRFYQIQFRPTGGTNMALGIQRAMAQNPNRIIILSDGATYDKDQCINFAHQCHGRNIKIDTIAIGEADEQFLQTLSELTGGKFQRAQNPQELEKAFEHLETRNYLMLEHKNG